MEKEELLKKVNKGWYSLIELAHTISTIIPFANILDISNNHSMLQIIFEKRLDKHEQYVLDCIAYKIERDSARLCEDCGLYGVRRLNLPEKQTLCTSCYALKYSAYMESLTVTE